MTSRPMHIAALDAALTAAVERFEEAHGARNDAMERNAADWHRINREIDEPRKARHDAKTDVRETMKALDTLGYTPPPELKERLTASQKSFYEADEWKAATVAAQIPVPVEYEVEDF